MEGLEKELKILKLKALGIVNNNLLYKYCSEVHKMFSKLYNIFDKVNSILFWLILVSFTLIILIVNYTNINKTPFIIIISLLLCSIAIIFIYPIIAVFFQLKIWLEFKNINLLTIKSVCTFFLRSAETFVIIVSFAISLYIFIKIIILKLVIGHIEDISLPDSLIDKYISPITLIFICSIPLFTLA